MTRLRRKRALDPQAALRTTFVRLMGGCDACGHFLGVRSVAEDLGTTDAAVHRFARDKKRLGPELLERIRWYTWRLLHSIEEDEGPRWPHRSPPIMHKSSYGVKRHMSDRKARSQNEKERLRDKAGNGTADM